MSQVGGGTGLCISQLSQGQYQAQLGPRSQTPMAIRMNQKKMPPRNTELAKGRSFRL
jgi:hypothetical protein